MAINTSSNTPAKYGANVLKSVGNGVKYSHRSEYDFTGSDIFFGTQIGSDGKIGNSQNAASLNLYANGRIKVCISVV